MLSKKEEQGIRRKKALSLFMVLALVMGLFMGIGETVQAHTFEGTGTNESPYLIRTEEDLYSMPNNTTA